MPHDPRVLLEDIRLAAQDIQDFTQGRALPDYQCDRLLRAAVERLFILIGEALTRLDRLDTSLASRITDYQKIIGLRNIIVHGYEVIDDQVVWQAVQTSLPILRQEVEGLIASLESQ